MAAPADILIFGFGNGTFDPGVNKLPTLGYSVGTLVRITAVQQSAAELISLILISQGIGVKPTSVIGTTSWPIYKVNHPDLPDNSIVVLDQSPILQGRFMFGGQFQERNGLQIIVRSASYNPGYAKSKEILNYLEETLYQVSVTALDGNSYTVHAFSRSSGPIPLGKELEGRNASKRYLFSSNGTITFVQDP